MNDILPSGADAYADLTSYSLMLAGIRHASVPAAVNVALPKIQPDAIFAGVSTALNFARSLALATGRVLRVVTLTEYYDPEPLRIAVTRHLAAGGREVPPVVVVPQPLLPHLSISDEDIWIATLWNTAHAASVAAELGVLDPSRVVYLIQDYEPGFAPWSVQHALTRATYHAGFHHVVNSRPLATYLAAHEGDTADHGLVFAPHLELDRLERASEARRASDHVRIFFYSRPSKPRNLYQLGVATLKHASTRLADLRIPFRVSSAGEAHPSVALPGGGSVENLGILGWDTYFDLLGQLDVGLSLMYSPHPSHPPLEFAVSGALAVTNDLDGVRQDFHPRAQAVAADVTSLSAALVEAVQHAFDNGPAGFSAPADSVLGDPLDSVVERLVDRL